MYTYLVCALEKKATNEGSCSRDYLFLPLAGLVAQSSQAVSKEDLMRPKQFMAPRGLLDARLHTPPQVQFGWPGNSSAFRYLRIAVSSNVQWRRGPRAI